jgi:hypothetical protein
MEEDITNTNIQPFSPISQDNHSSERIDLECVYAITDNMNITTILEDTDKVVKESEEIIQQIENIIISDAENIVELADTKADGKMAELPSETIAVTEILETAESAAIAPTTEPVEINRIE